jgi:hypothetical protein
VESATHAVEYRVRFPDATWSEWVGEGGFAGTRGQSLPITGFAARIAEGFREQYEVQVRGLFVGGVAVDARGGADCVTATNARMRGVQVVVRPAKPTATSEKPAATSEKPTNAPAG